MTVTSSGASVCYLPDLTAVAIRHAAPRTRQYLVSPFLLGGALLSGILCGTSTTAPVSTSHTYYFGGWTSNARTTSDDTSVRLPASALAELAVPDVSGLQSLTDQASIRWLHAESGLTWDQVGRVFGVSRRAVHLWATGGRMNAANAETLAELVALVRKLPAHNPTDRRAALLAPDPTGRSVIDRFRARQSSGSGDVSGTPWSPRQLLGALHDRPSLAT